MESLIHRKAWIVSILNVYVSFVTIHAFIGINPEVLSMASFSVRRWVRRQRGFTLIEVMIVVAIVAILAAIALPSYQNYIKKSRARGAAADLMALSLVLENRFQKKLEYPAYATETTIAASVDDRTDPAKTDFGAWQPAQGAFFAYTVESTGKTYTLKAKGSGVMSACTLSLTHANVRNAANSCTILGAW